MFVWARLGWKTLWPTMVDLVFLNDGNLPVESIRSDEGSQQLLGAAAKHHRTTRTNLGGTDFRSKLLGVERKSLELTGGCSYCLRMNQVKSKVENTFVHSDNLALDWMFIAWSPAVVWGCGLFATLSDHWWIVCKRFPDGRRWSHH